MMSTSVPRWDLTNVYPSLDSPEFEAAFRQYEQEIAVIRDLTSTRLAGTNARTPIPKLSALLVEAVERFNQLYTLESTLQSYIYAFVSTNSKDTFAARRLSEFEQKRLPLVQAETRFKAWVGSLRPVLEETIESHPLTQAHAFYLRETAEQARYLMSAAEEDLAAELNLSGALAWEKLQGTVTSQSVIDFDLEGVSQKLPLPALINLHSHPDEDVRRRAYFAELSVLEGMSEPLAASLNGIKGAVNTLNRRRGRVDALDSAIDRARIDRQSLAAMLESMEASFPVFHRYFQAKARRLGKQRLAFWDLFAPTGEVKRSFTFPEARRFVLENFAAFSTDLANLAQTAFERRWIDAEQRPGKRGGGFCMSLAGVKESRILCNFDGSLDQVSTIAHELGHAFHNQCAFAAGKTELQSIRPMTLAETASILCETITMQAVLRQAATPQEELGILETMLIGYSQVIVDIYSRYLFEKEVFERRVNSELSVEDFCDIMRRAQLATYGDGLDERYLHPFMWTWKPHYYSLGRSFYNFPYAFGLLFGLGLYALYLQRGADFVPEYQQLLANTGEAPAVELAAGFGIEIRTRKFWDEGLGVIAGTIDRYCAI